MLCRQWLYRNSNQLPIEPSDVLHTSRSHTTFCRLLCIYAKRPTAPYSMTHQRQIWFHFCCYFSWIEFCFRFHLKRLKAHLWISRSIVGLLVSRTEIKAKVYQSIKASHYNWIKLNATNIKWCSYATQFKWLKMGLQTFERMGLQRGINMLTR